LRIAPLLMLSSLDEDLKTAVAVDVG
ncbi:hypothetical protein NPIL_575681, partial [Nephila pilipes]